MSKVRPQAAERANYDYSKLPPLSKYLEAGPLMDLWKSYELELRRRRRSLNTFRTYREGVRDCQRFLLRAGRPTDPYEISEQDMLDFLDDVVSNHSLSTERARFRAMAGFFRWLDEEEDRAGWRSPMWKLKEPKVEEQVDAVTDSEVEALLSQCRSREHLDLRDKALILALLDTGGRKSELMSMRRDPERLNLDEGWAMVVGKGGRLERIFFGAGTIRAIDRYVRGPRARHPYAASAALWLGEQGPLSGDGLYRMIRRRAKRAGIGRNIHPHQFRHKWAHEWKSQRVTDSDLMTAGRWRDQKSVRRYGLALAEARVRKLQMEISVADRFA